MEQLHSVGCPPSRASVPALFGCIGTVIAGGDVPESSRANQRTVNLRSEEPARASGLPVQQRDQTGPQGCYRTGSANHELLAIDTDDVACSWIGVPANVGNTPAFAATRVR